MEWQKEELKYGTVVESCRQIYQRAKHRDVLMFGYRWLVGKNILELLMGGSPAVLDEYAATLFGIKVVVDFDRPCFIGLYKEVK